MFASTADIGDVDFRNLGSSPWSSPRQAARWAAVDLDSTTDLTISHARFRSIEMRHSHRTHLFDNTIGGTQANRALTS